MQLLVAHHHGFKCAGSTFIQLLCRNWLERVLFVEHRVVDRRIRCTDIEPLVVEGKFRAATSHLLTMPESGQAVAHVHFALVRDPIARLVSVYNFVPAESRFGDFHEFVSAHEHYACEYHVRQLGTLAPDTDGWQANLDNVPLEHPNVLIGLVERFDESMFLLERRLAAVGQKFDASVGSRQNVGQGRAPDLDSATVADLRARNAADYVLYERASAALDRELAGVDPTGSGLAEYRRRCKKRAGVKERFLGAAPEHWVYLED
jgi:hypothetical protein